MSRNLFLFFMLLAMPQLARGTDSEHCSFYRAKRDGVPVFEQADTTSAIIDRLAIGREVCGIGERDGFIILDWRAEKEGGKVAAREQAYARLFDLWPPRSAPRRDTGLFNTIKEYAEYVRSGGVVEDTLAPLRSALRGILGEEFFSEPECLAGKICEKLALPSSSPSRGPTETSSPASAE